MPLTETMKMGLHRVAWQIFFNRITRAFLEGWNYIWKYLLTTKVKRLREQYSQQLFIREMFCFMPVLPWIAGGNVRWSCRNSHEDWREEPGDNREEQFTYLSKNKTIHMISLLRNETCSGSISDLAHISTQNCLADCVTKSSAKADSLITALKAVRFLEVDVRPNIRTLMEHKAFLSTWCATFMHTRERIVFFVNAFKISLSPVPREGPSRVMFARTSMDSESQDSTKITFALADSRIYSFTKMVTFYMCIVKVTIFLRVSLSFSPSVVAMWTSRPAGLCRINRWTKNSAEQAERNGKPLLWVSGFFQTQCVDLQFNEEVKPERFKETLDHAGFNPNTMRVSKSY